MLTLAHLGTELLQLSAQSLTGSPGTLVPITAATWNTFFSPQHRHAIAVKEFRDEPTIRVYDDVLVVDKEIAVAETHIENIRLGARVSQRGTRER